MGKKKSSDKIEEKSFAKKNEKSENMLVESAPFYSKRMSIIGVVSKQINYIPIQQQLILKNTGYEFTKSH